MIVHYAWFTSQVLVARKGIYIYTYLKENLSPLNVVSLPLSNLFPSFIHLHTGASHPPFFLAYYKTWPVGPGQVL